MRVATWRLRVGVACVVAAVTPVWVGCAADHDHASSGGHEHGSERSTSTAGHGHHDGAAKDASTGTAVRVGLTEWSIATSTSTVPAGELTLRVTNAGATEHDVLVRGHAGTRHSTHLGPGEQTSLTVRAEAGEVLTLWCSLPGHEASGMRTTLEVEE